MLVNNGEKLLYIIILEITLKFHKQILSDTNIVIMWDD